MQRLVSPERGPLRQLELERVPELRRQGAPKSRSQRTKYWSRGRGVGVATPSSSRAVSTSSRWRTSAYRAAARTRSAKRSGPAHRSADAADSLAASTQPAGSAARRSISTPRSAEAPRRREAPARRDERSTSTPCAAQPAQHRDHASSGGSTLARAAVRGGRRASAAGLTARGPCGTRADDLIRGSLPAEQLRAAATGLGEGRAPLRVVEECAEFVRQAVDVVDRDQHGGIVDDLPHRREVRRDDRRPAAIASRQVSPKPSARLGGRSTVAAR